MTKKKTLPKTKKIRRSTVKRNEKTAAEVKVMSQYGIHQDFMAAYLGLSVEDLTALYRDEIDRGWAIGNIKFREAMHKRAMNGDMSAAAFWAKSRTNGIALQEKAINAALRSAEAAPGQSAERGGRE